MLKNLGADTKDAGANEERDVEVSSAGCIEDPVEAGGEDEKGQTMEDFVVDIGVELQGGQTRVACCGEEEEECS